MSKKVIKRPMSTELQKELDFLYEQGRLTDTQKEDILSQYEVKDKMNFIRILLTVGAFLLGIGVISFIANGWMALGVMWKLLLIVVFFIGANFTGFKLERNYPKTARTMHYLGIFLYGAGIILINQIAGLYMEDSTPLLIWVLGILPIGFLLKDRLIMVLASVSLFYYTIGFYEDTQKLPYLMFILIPILYMISKNMNYSKVVTAFANILAIQLIYLSLIHFIGFDESTFVFILLAMYIIGLLMVFLPVPNKVKSVFEWQGNMIHGINAFLLTFSFFSNSSFLGEYFYLVFSLFYFLFVLYLIKRGSLFNIIILCVIILRFYIDFTYGILPKSMIFIVGGLILMGFGYYFERKRKGGN